VQQPFLMFRGSSKMQRSHLDPCSVRYTIVSAIESVSEIALNARGSKKLWSKS